MPTYAITYPKQPKPLPALPYKERSRKGLLSNSIGSPSNRARSTSTQLVLRSKYPHEPEGSTSSRDNAHPSSRPRARSILKSPRSSAGENGSRRQRSNSKTVRFLPIIDSLLRHALQSQCVLHDLRFPPHNARVPSVADHMLLGSLRHAISYLSLCKKTREQPAVCPPMSRIWIVAREFPWVVEVNGSGRRKRDSACPCSASSRCKTHPPNVENFVTIYDVLSALWSSLQQPVVQSEWEMISPSHQKEIRRTGFMAYENEPLRAAMDAQSTFAQSQRIPVRAVRRIDWLKNHTRFDGLGKDEDLIAEKVHHPWAREATWSLVLQDNGSRDGGLNRVF